MKPIENLAIKKQTSEQLKHRQFSQGEATNIILLALFGKAKTSPFQNFIEVRGVKMSAKTTKLIFWMSLKYYVTKRGIISGSAQSHNFQRGQMPGVVIFTAQTFATKSDACFDTLCYLVCVFAVRKRQS